MGKSPGVYQNLRFEQPEVKFKPQLRYIEPKESAHSDDNTKRQLKPPPKEIHLPTRDPILVGDAPKQVKTRDTVLFLKENNQYRNKS